MVSESHFPDLPIVAELPPGTSAPGMSLGRASGLSSSVWLRRPRRHRIAHGTVAKPGYSRGRGGWAACRRGKCSWTGM